MENEQKPLHVVKKDKSVPVVMDVEQKVAEDKADELAVHFPNGMQYYVTSEQDDDNISFYLNFKLEF